MRKRFSAVIVIGLAFIFPASINTQWHTNGFLNFPGAVVVESHMNSARRWTQSENLQTYDYFSMALSQLRHDGNTATGYTFETRFFLNEVEAPYTLLALGASNDAPPAFHLRTENGSKLVAEFENEQGTALKLVATNKLKANAWLEVAVVYEALATEAARARLYLNGELLVQTEGAIAWQEPERCMLFLGNAPGGKILSGKLDEVRISNVARYAAAYTPSLQKQGMDAHTLGFWNFEQAHATEQWQSKLKAAKGARLEDFTVKRHARDLVAVEWRTDLEQGLEGFVVERREGTANGEFVRCGYMPALGDSRVPQAYRFVDKIPVHQKYYYRLRALARNGDSGFSHEVAMQD